MELTKVCVCILVILLPRASPTPFCRYQPHGTAQSISSEVKECDLFTPVVCKEQDDSNASGIDQSPVSYTPTDEYVNASFELRFVEGILNVKSETELCWHFRLNTSRVYPIYLWLDYLPPVTWGELEIYGDECSFSKPPTVVIQNRSPEKKELWFKFNKPPDTEDTEITLELLGGNCTITCDSSTLNECPVSLETRDVTDLTKPTEFKDLKSKTYCFRVHYHNCVFHTDTEIIKESVTRYSGFLPSDDPNRDYMYLILGGVTTAIIVFGILIKVVHTKTCGSGGQMRGHAVLTEEPAPRLHWHKIKNMWMHSRDSKKVLLLYSRDAPHLTQVIRALQNILKKITNLTILDPLEESQIEEVSQNMPAWLMKQLLNPDVKVVIVVTDGAMIRQQALLENKLLYFSQPHFLDYLFTNALHYLHEHPTLGNDYSRIFPIRFEDFTGSDVKLSLIAPLRSHVIFRHLGQLILELKECPDMHEADLDDLRQMCPEEMQDLEMAVNKMATFCKENPQYLTTLFSELE